MNDRARRLLWCAGALAVVFLVAALLIPVLIEPALRACDFAAFYCAGQAVAHGADPYRVLGLAACEHRVATGPFFAGVAVMPAPLPPYALAGLALVSRLPFAVAQHALDAASLAAFAVSAYGLHRLTRVPALVVAFAIAPFAWAIVMLGQTLLLMLAALTVCAMLLHARRDRCAALAAAVLMVEPHVGVAVCAALLVARPRTRPVLLAIGALCALVSVVALSWPVVLEYFTAVLPLQARSELTSGAQFSLSAVLAALGVHGPAALRAGALQYALFAAGGVIVARLVAARLGASSALVFLPPLFALFGGTYVHGTDFVLTVPAALLLAADGVPAVWATAALVGLIAQWKPVGGLPGMLLAIVAGAVVVYGRHRRLLPALAVAAGFALATAWIATLPDAAHAAAPHARPADFAQVPWEDYVRASAAGIADWVVRVPLWGGLALLCAWTAALAFAPPQRAPASRVALGMQP